MVSDDAAAVDVVSDDVDDVADVDDDLHPHRHVHHRLHETPDTEADADVSADDHHKHPACHVSNAIHLYHGNVLPMHKHPPTNPL